MRISDWSSDGCSSDLPAPLLHRPDQVGFDRGGVLVEVMTVEAEARLQAQRVACAEPRRRPLGLRPPAPRDLPGLLGRHRDLLSVLAGVSGPAAHALHAVLGYTVCVPYTELFLHRPPT